MKKFRHWRVIAVAIGIAAASGSRGDEEIDIVPAQNAAQAWLATVDAGKYGQSWDDASEFFHEFVSRETWVTSVGAARGLVGTAIARKLRSATYTRVLPAAPPGEYVVIQYDTRFDNKPISVETITPMREKDGTWKVSGYLIR